MPTHSSLALTHITDFLSFLSSSFPSNRWRVQKARSSAENVHGFRRENLSIEQEGLMRVDVYVYVCVCAHAAEIGRQAVKTTVWIVCAEMWHTVRAQTLFCYELELFLLYMWEDGSAASQEQGQQQSFVLLADNTAVLAHNIVERIWFLRVYMQTGSLLLQNLQCTEPSQSYLT